MGRLPRYGWGGARRRRNAWAFGRNCRGPLMPSFIVQLYMGKRASLYRSIGEYKLFCKHSPSALNDHTADDSYFYAFQRTLLTSESCPIICMGRFCRYSRKIKAARGSGCCSFYVVKRCRTSFSIVCGVITSARGRRKKFFCAPCFLKLLLR